MYNNHAGRGELFEATTGSAVVSLATGVLRGVLNNPSNSGKQLVITRVSLGNSTTIQNVTLILNSSTVPGTAITPWNHLLGSAVASQATFKYDITTTGLAGGTTLTSYLLYGGLSTQVVFPENPICITPGNSFGYYTSAFGLTAASECNINWIEVSI